MRPRPAVRALLPCLVAALVAAWQASALESLPSPRLAAGRDGEAWASFQAIDPEGDDSFHLYQYLPGLRAWEARGRFMGVLAGMAWGDGSLWLAMRDGVLVRYGDEGPPVARADGGRRLLDLTWRDGRPVALAHEYGRFRLVKPDGNGDWEEDSPVIAFDPAVRRARMIEYAGKTHLVWSPDRDDLSGGMLRHVVWNGIAWQERPPHRIGDASAFALFIGRDGLRLTASVHDPLSRDRPALLRPFTWADDAWHADPALTLPDAVRRGSDFAALGAGDGAVHWLAASPGATTVYTIGEGRLEKTTFDIGAGGDLAWMRTAILSLAALVAVLVVRQARRSRALSAAMPGSPADLLTRGVALFVDYVLASIGVAAYHIASGDLVIMGEVLTAAMLNQAFWINLGGLAFFMFVMESRLGLTPGKWLMGIRVRNAGGGPISPRQAVLRNLLRAADMFPLVFPGVVGALAALFNPNRQRLGDMFAGTVVRRHCPIEQRAVILASASPRRRELLEALGLNFRTSPADVDEDAIRGGTPEETARALAEAKAGKVAEAEARRGEIVIAADTMVVVDGEVLGKPADADEARRMLSRLSGRSHAVVTAVTVFDGATGRGVSDADITEVEFRDLSEAEIDRYVASGDPMDKAGAYGIQSGFLVKEVRGSLSNVAGLPMETLRELLDFLDG
ncbi:MAG: Maf family nucleotide pyrophosphatase [Planctomycetota bacterium]|jgi:septum formation protein|nr:Maf family nucleotide pyrophosphatase [Planctomycetota bacterium]